MDIAETRMLKEQLRQNVKDECYAFTQQTGLVVTSVELSRQDAVTAGGERCPEGTRYAVDVCVEV